MDGAHGTVTKDTSYFNIAMMGARLQLPKSNFISRVLPRNLTVFTDVDLVRGPLTHSFRSLSESSPFRGTPPFTQGFGVADATPANIDSVKVKISLVVTKSDRLKAWEQVISTGALSVVASLSPPVIPVAAVIKRVVDRVAETILASPDFEFAPVLTASLNTSELAEAHYLISEDRFEGQHVSITDGEVLVRGSTPSRSYLLLEVSSFPLHGRDVSDRTLWNQLLTDAENDAQSAGRSVTSDTGRRDAQQRFEGSIASVRTLLEQDLSYLPSERRKILQDSYAETTRLLSTLAAGQGATREGAIAEEVPSPEELPELTPTAGSLLGVASNEQLIRNVSEYRVQLAENPPPQLA